MEDRNVGMLITQLVAHKLYYIYHLPFFYSQAVKVDVVIGRPVAHCHSAITIKQTLYQLSDRISQNIAEQKNT